nr:hypothetical protein FFPRI1PSEUD_34930 [Pseudomonas sp. FFPRI_1]
MSQDYNFFAAQLKSNAAVSLTEVSGLLRQWFGLMQLPIQRYGSPSGKVVKFAEKGYEKALLAKQRRGFYLWDMTGADQSAARKELIKHELLAACIDPSAGPAI